VGDVSIVIGFGFFRFGVLCDRDSSGFTGASAELDWSEAKEKSKSKRQTSKGKRKEPQFRPFNC
jgi:hypothetical protein